MTIEDKYIDASIESIISCCSVVAAFNEIKVSKIEFYVERNDEYAGCFADTKAFNVSEIAVMGRTTV
jgi:hypothetical protein